MRTKSILLLLSLALFPFLPGAAALGRQTVWVVADCGNHGAQVNIGSQYLCDAASGCSNSGVIANVGSSYGCGGPCSNEGVVVNVGSVYCGTPLVLQACYANVCVPPSERTALQVVFIGFDCGFAPLLTGWACQGDQPCGILQSPACWTARFACTNALAGVFRAYNSLVGSPELDCQEQPGSFAPWHCCPIGSTFCMIQLYGECADGSCLVNAIEVCSGTCQVNVAGVCQGSCYLNAVNVCTGGCTVEVAGTCLTVTRPVPAPDAAPGGETAGEGAPPDAPPGE